MRLPTKEPRPVPAGVSGTLRTERPTRLLLTRLRPGDVAVIDHTDLDRATGEALVSAGVTAVVNAQPMISGRFPNRGPEVLAEAGVLLVDGVGESGFSSLADGRPVRIDDGSIYDGEQRLTAGRELGRDDVRREMERARAGLAAQLESLAHNSSELLRREEDLLLHGEEVPRLTADLADQPVLVVSGSPGASAQLRRLRSYLVEQRPIVVAVGAGAAVARSAGLRPAVVVIGADSDAVPQASVLRHARDVVLVGDGCDPGEESLARMGVKPLRLRTDLAPADAALLLAHAHHARLVIGAGLDAGLTDLLEGSRPSPAGGFLTRMVVGPRLLDAGTVAALYSGPVHRRHLVLALLVALLLVALAVATTPVGQDLVRPVWQHLRALGTGE